MNRKCIFLIPLLIATTSYLIYADSVDYPRKHDMDTHHSQTNLTIPGQQLNKNLYDYAISHYRRIYMKSFFKDIQPSLRSLVDSKIMENRTVHLKSKVKFNDLMKFQPSVIHEYMDEYRTGSGDFGFPFTIKGSSSYYDQDVIESWDYQKNMMYPYGHTPSDFYHP
jgi:hypothetical protein